MPRQTNSGGNLLAAEIAKRIRYELFKAFGTRRKIKNNYPCSLPHQIIKIKVDLSTIGCVVVSGRGKNTQKMYFRSF